MSLLDLIRARYGPPSISGRVRVTTEPEDRPQWRRVYEANISNGFKVKVSLRSHFTWSRSDTSTLTQPDGRWILFDVHRVADKIIDRELYPLVQEVVDEILELDRRFLASNPSEFTDEAGTIWRR